MWDGMDAAYCFAWWEPIGVTLKKRSIGSWILRTIGVLGFIAFSVIVHPYDKALSSKPLPQVVLIAAVAGLVLFYLTVFLPVKIGLTRSAIEISRLNLHGQTIVTFKFDGIRALRIEQDSAGRYVARVQLIDNQQFFLGLPQKEDIRENVLAFLKRWHVPIDFDPNIVKLHRG
jgi:hypothetical protein